MGEQAPFTPVTNPIESITFRLRKVTKNRGHFPQVDAAIKLLYLALRNVNPPPDSVVTVSTGTASVALSEHRSRCRR